MTNFGIKSARTGHVQDTRWRAFAHGEDTARPGQIDPADFTALVGLVNPGYIPSGVALTIKAGKIVPLTDAEDVLYGFINDDDGIEVATGDTYATIAVLLHGGINPNYLPVVAQRDLVKAATGTHFIVTEV